MFKRNFTNIFPRNYINEDQIINIQDIVLIVGIIIGTFDPSEEQQSAADINQDGTVDVLDLVVLVNYILAPD